jgi:lipopolysaccharide biosynthesis regulator YciM
MKINQKLFPIFLVEKAKKHFELGDFRASSEDLDDAFRFAPSVSAKILRLKMYVQRGKFEEAQLLLIELIKEHPMYASFIFVSLDDYNAPTGEEDYRKNLIHLKKYFLGMDDIESSPSVILAQIRLLKDENKTKEAFDLLENWMKINPSQSDILQVEFVKLLIEVGKEEEALAQTKKLLNSLHNTLARHYCSHCGFNSDQIFWRCQQCHNWETIQFRWKV